MLGVSESPWKAHEEMYGKHQVWFLLFFKKYYACNKCITVHKGMYEKHLMGKEEFQGLAVFVGRTWLWATSGCGANSRCKFISLLSWPSREERTGTLQSLLSLWCCGGESTLPSFHFQPLHFLPACYSRGWYLFQFV